MLNFQDVSNEKPEYEIFPDGKHIVSVHSIIFKEDTSSGIPAFVAEFVEEESNKMLTRQYFSYSPNSLWRIKTFYEAVTGQELMEDFGDSPDCYYKATAFFKTLVGRKLGVTVVHKDQDKINPKTNENYKKAEIEEFHYLGKARSNPAPVAPNKNNKIPF